MSGPLLINPAGEAWETWFDSEGVSSEFMAEREQATAQAREPR